MSCPKLSIPGIPDSPAAGDDAHDQNESIDVPEYYPGYHDRTLEESQQAGAFAHLPPRAYLQDRKIPMLELTDTRSLERARLQEEIARLRAAKNQEVQWTDIPMDRFQRTPSCPSINRAPSRVSIENQGIRLDPQPTISPEDPLNWSWWKKHAVLAALIPGCLLSDWTLTWGTTVFELQAPEWYAHETLSMLSR